MATSDIIAAAQHQNIDATHMSGTSCSLLALANFDLVICVEIVSKKCQNKTNFGEHSFLSNRSCRYRVNGDSINVGSQKEVLIYIYMWCAASEIHAF